MPGKNQIKDRYGLPMSTGSVLAAECYVDGTDLLLSMVFGSEERYRKAIEADEGFALAHGALAYRLMYEGKMKEAKASALRARSLASGTSRWERRHVEAIALMIEGPGPRALTYIREHLAEYPRDVLLLTAAQDLLFYGCSGGGSASFPQDMMALLKGVESSYGEDWAFLGLYAFAHHESGLLDDALRLAQHSLDLRPDNAHGSHSVAHVFFERSQNDEGNDFLDNWIQGYDRRSPYYGHLIWHLALFQLAQGHYRQVLHLYEEGIRPFVAVKDPSSLADGASLMWRWQLYSGAAPPTALQELGDLASSVSHGPGSAYRDVHAALAFCCTGDGDGLDRMIQRLRNQGSTGDALAAEVMVPLLQGLDAFVRGAYEQALEFMEPLFGAAHLGQLVRIGGSHAQREVLEDTLIVAYLRTQRFDKVERLLRTRLKRRSSPRDLFWLAQAHEGSDRTEEARRSLAGVNLAWRDADPESPEMAALAGLGQKLR